MRNGGLGIRRVSSLASSAFLASAASTRGLQDRILSRVILINDDMFDKCLSTRISNGIQSPVDSDMHKQRKWDKTVINAEFNHLLSHYSKPYHKARLLAAAAPHSGDWLHALPISALWSASGRQRHSRGSRSSPRQRDV